MKQYNFTLPAQFEGYYFPGAASGDYESRQITFIQSPFFVWQMTLQVESQASQQARRSQAQNGVAVGALVLVPATVLLLFGIVYAALAAAALVLSVFFLVALPLGFFEFGAAILRGIIKQYLYIFAITLLAVALAGILVASGLLDVGAVAPEANPANLMLVIPIMVVVLMALSYVSIMAKEAMLSTFGVVGSSIRASFAPMAFVGAPPVGAGALHSAVGAVAGGTAATAGAAASAWATTGSARAALLAGSGAALHRFDSRMGQSTSRLAIAAVGPTTESNVFAAAARGAGASGVARHGLRGRRRARTQAANAYQQSATRSSQRPADSGREAQRSEAGAYQTVPLELLDKAGAAYLRGEKVVAQQQLESAFGQRAVARDVLAIYANEGAAGVGRVRAVVATAQQSASQQVARGEPLFGAKGQSSAALTEATWQALERAKLVGGRERAEAARIGRIAGAAVQRSETLWGEPSAARLLAEMTIGRGAQREVSLPPGDASARHGLRQLAEREQWGSAQLEALFQAVGQSLAATRGQPTPFQQLQAHTTTQLAGVGEWRSVRSPLQQEASRLALLIAESSHPVPPPTEQPINNEGNTS